MLETSQAGMGGFMDKFLMTIKEASQALGLSERSIFWLISTGQIESRKIGRRRLIPHAAVERFAARDHKSIRPTEAL
jgi:excisionase family DNA binding protein